MSSWIIGFCAGIAIWLWWSKLIALAWCLSVVVISALLVYFVPTKIKPLFIVWIALCVGFTWANFRAQRLLSWHLPESFINKPVQIEGRIIALPKISALSAHFNFKMNELDGQPTAVIVYLSWYGQYPALHVGDRWRLTVKLKPPHSLRNPGTFNYQRWLFVHGIRATGSVVSKKPQHLLHRNAWRFPINHVRQQIQSIIQQSVVHVPLDARHGERSEGAYSAVGSDFLPSVSDCKKSLRAVKSFESPCVVEP